LGFKLKILIRPVANYSAFSKACW